MTTDKRPLAPTGDSAAVADRLHSTAIHLLRRLRTADQASGIGPAQLSALSVLVFGGPRSLGELAEAEQVRPATMSRIVSGLVGSGLVRKRRTADRRRLRLAPTPKGLAALRRGRARRVTLLATAITTLRAEDRRRLAAAVDVLQDVVRRL